MKHIARLHYLTRNIEGRSHAELAEAACCAGIRWVQVRVKNREFAEWLSIGREVRQICSRYGATCIINDSVEIAREIGADGVHLGRLDTSLRDARRILGEAAIIGGTANTIDDALAAAQAGADYLGIGPFRFTFTKETLSPLLGLDGISRLTLRLRELCPDVPAVAIGGIRREDVADTLEAGAYGVAVSSAIDAAAFPGIEAAAFVDMFEGFEEICLNASKEKQHETASARR